MLYCVLVGLWTFRRAPQCELPVARHPATHHRTLVALLYARQAWVRRHPDGSLSAPSTKFAAAVGLRTYRLQAALLKLKDLGLIERLIWRGDWFYARPRVPVGLCRGVQPPDTPGEDVPQVLEAVFVTQETP